MKNPLFSVLFICLTTTIYGQTTIGRQLVDQYSTTSYGTKTYGLTWLPEDYNSTNISYPLIIFLHGSGEVGDGVDGLNNLITTGLPQEIANGWDPQAVNPVDGKSYNFIVVSPQAPTSSHWSYTYEHVKYILPDVLSRYRIDSTRIYITGISAGGGGTWSCVTNDSSFTKKIAAIGPVSSVSVNNPGVEYPNIQYISGKYDVSVWTICGTEDAWYKTADEYVGIINSANPAPEVPAAVTGIDGEGHSSGTWGKAYSASWRSNEFNLNLYEWMLQYQRNAFSKPANQAPIANAGTDKTITLPTDNVTLSGSATDADGTISTYLWTKISGPSQFNLESPGNQNTLVSNLTAGIYQFELTATDNNNASDKDTVTVTVLQNNQPPVVNAGKNKTIIQPTDSVTLNGSATDADGTISSYIWTKIAGPSQFTISDPNIASPLISNLVAGIYRFELTASDNNNASDKDTVVVKVLENNQAPVADAGADKSIILPTDSVTLNGSATDANGTISSYLWTKIAGPSQFTISDPNIASPLISNLVAGTYVFQLTVKDDAELADTDNVEITVNTSKNNYTNIPAVIEAESYTEMAGVQTEVTYDTGGGENVGYIDDQDWMDYNLYATKAGTFTVKFRVATLNNEARFDLRDAGGAVLTTIKVPNTGNYQAWTTVVAEVSLPAGYQTLRIISTTSIRWNFNWMEFIEGTLPPTAIPAKIEAEDFNAMQGIQLEKTGDKDGNLNVGWIDNGDWIDYTVNAAVGGTYSVSLRVAAADYGAQLQIRTVNDDVLATVPVPQTGGYQSWSTVNTTISIPAGKQTLKIISTAYQNWNINWVDFAEVSALTTKNPNSISVSTGKGLAFADKSSFEVSPNPVNSDFTLQINNKNTGLLRVQIVNMQGATIKKFQLNKNVTGSQAFKLSSNNLSSGTYVIYVQLDNWSASKIILKL